MTARPDSLGGSEELERYRDFLRHVEPAAVADLIAFIRDRHEPVLAALSEAEARAEAAEKERDALREARDTWHETKVFEANAFEDALEAERTRSSRMRDDLEFISETCVHNHKPGTEDETNTCAPCIALASLLEAGPTPDSPTPAQEGADG